MTPFSVVIPTRGDVPLDDIIASYDGIADEVLVWDNSKRQDLAVYGRYALIAEARNDLIFTQDDDCIVSDPIEMVKTWEAASKAVARVVPDDWRSDLFVLCNMPPEFRQQPFYENCALVGFGAVFHRDAPEWAFYRFAEAGHSYRPFVPKDFFNRRCDILFTALTLRVLVDVPKTNLWWAEESTRMYRQKNHMGERQQMLDLALKVRDA